MKQKTKFKQTEIGMIPEDWEVDKLKNHLIIKGRIGWKGLKKSEYLQDGYAIINGEQIIEDNIDWINVGRITKERYDESPEIILKQDDILMTKDGTIGKLAYLEELPEPATVASGVFVIRNNSKKLNQRYLYYYFKSNFFKWLVESRLEGSVVPHLYQRDIVELNIPLPSMLEQEMISLILYDLDRKIKLNQSENATLETIGRAIFKHWFIDFEFPNEEGKPYKSSGGEMIDSEFGKIPKGWSVKRLNNLLKSIESGRRPQGGIDQTLKAGIPSIGAENVNGLGFYEYSSTKYISQEYFEQMKQGVVKDNDVLLYKDGAQLGRKTMFGKGFPFSICCVNEHVFILRANEKLNQVFLYFWLDQNKITENIKNLNANSAQPGINKESVGTLEIIVPEKRILNLFEKIIKFVIEKIFLNCLESQNLAQIRDSLLPKLMSGKVRVV